MKNLFYTCQLPKEQQLEATLVLTYFSCENKEGSGWYFKDLTVLYSFQKGVWFCRNTVKPFLRNQVLRWHSFNSSPIGFDM